MTHNGSPYADFSVFNPFGRRAQKQMKAKGFMLQEDVNSLKFQARQLLRLGQLAGTFTRLRS